MIWTCTAFDPDNPVPLPTMPHWDDGGFPANQLCPAFAVNSFASRKSGRGFLDVAHFARIPPDTFADPSNRKLVPTDQPQETPFRFVADYWSSVSNYPAEFTRAGARRIPVAAPF